MHPNVQTEPSDAEYVRRTAAYWRARADEARVMARQMGEVDGAKMLQVAKICDDLAKQEERCEAATPTLVAIGARHH